MYNTLSLFSFFFFLKKKVCFKIDHNPFEDKYEENLVTIHYISFIFSEMYQERRYSSLQLFSIVVYNYIVVYRIWLQFDYFFRIWLQFIL